MLKYFIFFFFVCKFANGINWHASQIILKKLYEIQNEHFIVMNEYLEMEMKRIRELERALLPISNWYLENVSVEKRRVRNHMYSLKCMTKMFANILKTRPLFNNERSKEALKKLNENQILGVEDLQSAHRSLRRIQRVYAIPASDMVEGIFRLRGQTIGDRMNVCECYVMCENCFVHEDMYGAIDWAIQTYNKWSIDRPKCVDIERLQYYVKWASIPTGFDYKRSIFRGLEILGNSEQFPQCISLKSNDFAFPGNGESSDLNGIYDYYELDEKGIKFRHFCRTGISTRPLTNNSKCRYQTKNSFYRILMPFKEEDVSSNPYMKLYHDILYDNEIKTIIKLVENDLTDAQYYINGKTSMIEQKRLGQLKWIWEDENRQIFDKLNERVETVTEFSTKTAEGYQTVNYGLGGHFTVHVDAFADGPKLHGNRLVTVLFYLSDVDNDGFTVFPNLNYAMHCQRGSALVWQNLFLNNGSIHSGTYHGGCPVIKGNKWIMTKGLYESGQNLTYNWRENKNIVIV